MRPRLRGDLGSLSAYLAPQIEAPIRLNTNESAHPLPPAFADDLAAAVRGIEFHRYPDREAKDLRAALAAHTGHSAEGIWVANGSNEVIQQLCLAYAGPGRKVLLFDPTYSMHSLIPRMVGAELAREPLPPGFWLETEGAVDAVERHDPAIVFVCSPNNPTGNAQSLEVVDALCGAAPLVLVDEAYIEFGGETAQPLLERHENLVVVRTFSKAFSLAAARLGYCLCAPALLEDLARVRLPYHLSSLTQAAGLAALRHLGEAEAILTTIAARRDRLFERLDRMPGVQPSRSQANFVLFRTDVEARALWEALLRRGILVRDVSNYPMLERCLRVTAGTDEEIDAFIEALPDCFEEVVP
ncbi:MAG TPA: histidinol-phosphate transaminase [Actinomycetota bacterium]|nr:histidinol-phosphate transaminase [Actinomycetota bacterium]